VSYVDFTRGYKIQSWSASDCRLKLQSSLDVPVELHFGADHMPAEARITLQEVIRQWPDSDALPAMQRAIGGLVFLVPRATPEYRPLAESYLKTLLAYVGASQSAAIERPLGNHPPSVLNGAKAEAIKQLDALDRQREAIWTNSVSPHLPQLSAVGQPEAKSADGR
jgi:hypothetical protein